MRNLRANIGVCYSCRALSQYTSLLKCIDPHLPVLTAHYGDSLTKLVLSSRLDRRLRHFAAVEVYSLVRVGAAERLDDGREGLACLRMRSARRSNAVHHEIDLAELCANKVNRLRLNLIGEGISYNAVGFAASCSCSLLKGCRIIPACRCCTCALCCLVKIDANRVRACREGGYDS
ncbi:hypothetical protein D3C78_1155420 [compost metagenome]